MHVIGHQHIGVQPASSRCQDFAEPFEVDEVILIGEETGIAILAALDEVDVGSRDTTTGTGVSIAVSFPSRLMVSALMIPSGARSTVTARLA